MPLTHMRTNMEGDLAWKEISRPTCSKSTDRNKLIGNDIKCACDLPSVT